MRCIHSLNLILNSFHVGLLFNIHNYYRPYFYLICFLREVLFSVAFVCCCCCCFGFLLSISPQFFTRNIQDTSTKLSGIICTPPEQIKFEYHDSHSLLWLDKSKKPIIDLDLDLELSLPPQSMDGMSEFLHDGSPTCKLAGVHGESV